MYDPTLTYQRMVQVMEYAVKNDLAANESDYWEKVGFARTSITHIKKGSQSFTIKHILSACELTGASTDWVLGLEKNMFRDAKSKSPLEMLKQATAMLEEQMKRKSLKVFL